jgi:GT2 family glycosyltransferase
MKNVSFVIPSYNTEQTIGKSIQSILNQKYKGKIEVIVIDDCSTDNSINLIKKFKKIKLIQNKKNIGLAETLNKGIRNSKYELISIIWGDCILKTNNWLNHLVNIINQSEDTKVVTSKLIIPTQLWKRYGFWDKVILLKDIKSSKNKKDRDGRFALFKKEVFDEIGLYDSKTFRIAGEDTDLKWRIINKGYKIKHSNESLLHLHGMHKFSLKYQLFKKAFPLAEAIGVNYRKHGHKSLGNKYWNPVSSTILYGMLFTHLRVIGVIGITILITGYIINVLKYEKNLKIMLLPFFKIAKDVITIVGFWKGFITKKQGK